LPKELKFFLTNLCTAGSRIGIEGHLPLSKYGSTIGNVSVLNEGEEGDVLVRKLQSKSRGNRDAVVLRTRAVDASQRTLGIFQKMPRSAKNISSRLSAAYKSIYYAASEAEDKLDINPNCLVVEPLLGSDADGSDIKKVAAPIAWREALRAATFSSELRIIFEGGKYSHGDFRAELAMQLFLTFPEELEKREEEGNLGVLRSDLAAQLAAAFPEELGKRKEKRSLSGVKPALSSSKYKGIDDSSESSLDAYGEKSDVEGSEGSGKLDGADSASTEERYYSEESLFDAEDEVLRTNPSFSAEDETAASSSGVAEGEFGFRGNNRVEFVCNGWSTDIANPHYMQEWRGISLPKLKSELSSESHSEKSEADSFESSSISENDVVTPSMAIIEEAVVFGGESIPKSEHSGEVEEAVVAEERSRLAQSKKEKSQPEEHKPKNMLTRVAKGVRKVFNAKPVASENGKGVTFSKNFEEHFPRPVDVPVIVGPFSLNRKLMEVKMPPQSAEPKASESDHQVSPGRDAKSKLVKYQKQLAVLAYSLQDHWVNSSESMEIDVDRLLRDVESFSSSMEKFRSKVSRLGSNSMEGKVEMRVLKNWAQYRVSDLNKLTIELLMYSVLGDSGDKNELRNNLGGFMQLLKNVTER